MLPIEASSIFSVVHPYTELLILPWSLRDSTCTRRILRATHPSVSTENFAVLNTRNLLYLQSELADLEVQLQRLDAEGNGEEVDNDIWAISRNWRKMRDAGVSFQESKTAVADIQESQDPRDSWSVVLKIRRVLKEYSRLSRLNSSSGSSPHIVLDKALQAQAWLQSLEKPPKHLQKTMRAALEWDIDLRTSISEIDLEYLDSKNFRDTISLTPDPNRESFSRFLANKLSWLFLSSRERQGQRQKGFTVFSDRRVRRTTRLVAVVLSSILPVLSIVILYYVHSTDIHIGLIMVFSTLFSGVVALVSDARNVEVMAATAAYAAVLVVFVSGNLQSP